jgi:undecaprenyl-diphosphatase
VTPEASPGAARAGTSNLVAAGRRRDLVVLGLAVGVLALASLAAMTELTSTEVGTFRAVNELPDGLRVAVWPFMQYGTFVTIPVLAAVALAFRRFRLALAILLAGVGVYLLALITKQIVERGRPGAMLSGVQERETFGEGSLGFPSGHAAVAAAVTAVVAAHLSRRWLVVALGLGSVVLLGRVYVGAHLPLDVIGGAALGAVAGSVVNLVVRRQPGSPR